MKAERKTRLYYKIFGALFPPDVQFAEKSKSKLHLQEPCVIICNHTPNHKRLCLADGPMIRYVFYEENVCSLVAKDIMDNVFVKPFISNCECIPIERYSHSSEWLKVSMERLEKGCSVIIFPEGTTKKSEAVGAFKAGFVMLAKQANVPVLPVAVNGRYRPFRKHRLKFIIGKPERLRSDMENVRDMKHEAERFRKIVDSLYHRIET